jgi:hypothetical protein
MNGEGGPNGEFRAPRWRGKIWLHTDDRFGPGARRGRFVFRSMFDE